MQHQIDKDLVHRSEGLITSVEWHFFPSGASRKICDAQDLFGCDWREIAAHPPVPLWLRLEPDSVRDLLYRHGPGTGTPVAETPPSTSNPEWDLERWENSDFNWGLSMDDWTAHNDEDRVTQLALLLAAREGIERCIHEDRELILIASALDHATLMEAVNALWKGTEAA